MSTQFHIPTKINIYLKRIASEYRVDGNDIAMRVINSCHIFVKEEASYDNWNGGTYGHDVVLFLPPEVFGEVTLARKAEFEKDIFDKLRLCASSFENEFFNAVYIEDEDANDPEFQKAIPFYGRPKIDPDSLSIWKSGEIRLFISHRDNYKAQAKVLAEALEKYGISAFVAHDTIEPMKTWQSEIVKGLETMEIMLTFITDDFHESVWVNQEIGFALGRDIPIISFKIEQSDPRGFVENQQALKGKITDSAASVTKIYKLLAEKLNKKDRLQRGLVSAFTSSQSFMDTVDRFKRMKMLVNILTDDELEDITSAFRSNDQLHNSIYLNNNSERLKKFIERTTDKSCLINGKDITTRLDEEEEEDIPF